MTDQNSTPTSPQNPVPPSPSSETGHRRCGPGFQRRRWMLAGIAVATGLIGFGIGKATSAHWGRHFGHGFGMHRTMDADTLIRQTDAGVDRVLSRVDATPDQKTKITEIAKAAVKELLPLRDMHNAVRDKAIVALKADKIDRAVIEQLRTEELALAESLSKRGAQVMADIADILTPAQRIKLVDNWQQRYRRG